MKNFQKFLEEADIRGNLGIPGEGDKKPEDKPYLSNVEKRAKERLGVRPQDISKWTNAGYKPSEKEIELVTTLMPLQNKSFELTSPYMTELSKLVEDVFYNLYKDIIDRYEIELDIKLVKPGKIKEFMEEADDTDEPPKQKEIKDPETIREIQKRKIANLVIQGEAKNTKHLLHTDEIKQGFEKILGEEQGKLLFTTLDRIAKIMDQLDWILPESFRQHLMEEMPEGLAGAEKVEWKPKSKKDEEKKEEDEEEYQEFTGDEEYVEDDEEVNLEDETEEFTPVLRARGIDVSILIHESVKGLFEILSLSGLPVVKDEDAEIDKEKTKKLLDKIYANTGLMDEPQDWKFGPEIAADIRDFVNKNPKIDTYPNIREEIWKLMIDRKTMPTEKFLELIRGILSDTEKARIDVDILINKVVEKIKNEKEYKEKLDQYESDMEDYNRKMEEYNRKMKEWEEKMANRELEPTQSEEEPQSEIDMIVKKSLSSSKDDNDYSTWSQKEIQTEIDQAIDDRDFEKVELLSPYLKEGKIYLKELQILNERINPHTK
jgi:hypothetical protein